VFLNRAGAYLETPGCPFFSYDKVVTLRSGRPPPLAPAPPPAASPPPASSRATKSRASSSATSQADAREVRIRELEAALVRERAVTSALRDVSVAVGRPLAEDPLELILRKMTEVVLADRATLYLREPETGDFVSRVTSGGGDTNIRLHPGQGIAGTVAKYGKPLLVADAYEDVRFSPQWDLTTGYRTRTILAVPILDSTGATIGVAQVLNKSSGTFTKEDARTLAALASQAAVSLENFQLLSSVKEKNAELEAAKTQLEARVRDLKLLFELETAMSRVSSLEELLMSVIGEARRVTKAQGSAIVLRDPESGIATLHVLERGRIIRLPTREGEGLIGASMVSDEVIMTADAAADPRSSPALDKRAGFHAETALCVPLEGEDGYPVGAFGLYNKRGEGKGFSEEDRAMMLLIAANASTAVRLHSSRETREREERLTTIGRLLSGVLHDLKTPLTIISGYVQLMQNAHTKEQRDEYSSLVFKQFEHIGAMQRDILEFARGEKSVLARKVYLAKFFEEVRASLETSLAKSRVELVLDLHDKGTARFDEGKVLRVIHNLARNAAEAMAAKGSGTLTIKVQRDKEGSLVLTFSDTGPGIPKEIEHRLFRSFVTSGKKGGTGLGLAIVKRIAEEHGGTVSVHSTTRGASFKVLLPQPAKGD
jgi:K+-sensing histidine kinase KdpD